MKKLLSTIAVLTPLLMPFYAHADIQFVSRVENNLHVKPVPTITTPTFNAVAGNFIYLWVDMQPDRSFPDVTITDTAGNTWIQVGSDNGVGVAAGTSNTNFIYQYYAKNITGNASDAVTVSATCASDCGYATIVAYQFSGIDKTNPLDGFNFAAASQGNSMSSGSISISGSTDLLIGSMEADGQPITAGAGFNINLVNDSFGGYTADEWATTTPASGSSQAVVATQANFFNSWGLQGASFIAAATPPAVLFSRFVVHLGAPFRVFSGIPLKAN